MNNRSRKSHGGRERFPVRLLALILAALVLLAGFLAVRRAMQGSGDGTGNHEFETALSEPSEESGDIKETEEGPSEGTEKVTEEMAETQEEETEEETKADPRLESLSGIPAGTILAEEQIV